MPPAAPADGEEGGAGEEEAALQIAQAGLQLSLTAAMARVPGAAKAGG